jgi:alkanesulfonate monooxygenase SsuD/methylene tetrahydromethanopterin reductase-like flavin-dependent oxidoreductase (luciferase family)
MAPGGETRSPSEPMQAVGSRSPAPLGHPSHIRGFSHRPTAIGCCCTFGTCLAHRVNGVRFCAYQYQNVGLDQRRTRWLRAERLGFDIVWNADTVVEPDHRRHTMFDGPATLALMASHTKRIRVGTLVNSAYFRHPVTLAKAATTVDHISGGRLEIAVGVGSPSAGAAAVGVQWSASERVSRFAEFIELLDLLLRHESTDYDGQFYRCHGAENHPLAGAEAPASAHRCGPRSEDAAPRG